jgi:hypothetical protein
MRDCAKETRNTPKILLEAAREEVIWEISVCGFSPQANYTDRVTAACQRS